MSHMSSDELAKYVFEHHGCGSCHTMGSNGKLGYTERGKEVGKGFIGCVSLLTSMNLIAQVEPANRTPDEKAKAVKFPRVWLHDMPPNHPRENGAYQLRDQTQVIPHGMYRCRENF